MGRLVSSLSSIQGGEGHPNWAFFIGQGSPGQLDIHMFYICQAPKMAVYIHQSDDAHPTVFYVCIFGHNTRAFPRWFRLTAKRSRAVPGATATWKTKLIASSHFVNAHGQALVENKPGCSDPTDLWLLSLRNHPVDGGNYALHLIHYRTFSFPSTRHYTHI